MLLGSSSILTLIQAWSLEGRIVNALYADRGVRKEIY